ncbi:uncharacterized protein LOC107684847 [Sinocyclocheilus anshuiensis]|uniref:uncharacterized protein LOC107684847 n=1 Tax=Sinocyclocheilus anshuiensis TaxID=1608454 RepID=UPI0007B7E4E1|nr:PREDICTED: uncharacterized protein LOC107684847 [Sinocyclocheilus anshuiensis]
MVVSSEASSGPCELCSKYWPPCWSGFRSEELLAWPKDKRIPGKKFGSDDGGGEVKPWRRGEYVWLIEQRAGEAWSSAALSGGEGAILGPADWPEDPKISPTLDESQNTDRQKASLMRARTQTDRSPDDLKQHHTLLLDFREIMLIFGLMLLLQTAACLDRFCRFNQSDPCYAALGHKLNLMMVLDASEYDLKIIKRINNNTADGPVCRVKNGRMRDCDFYNNRPEVTVINGTLIINRVIRADSGNYRLTLVDSDGAETSRDLQVIVEAPIGSVEVSIICSSSGVMRVSCSSEGDPLLYSWTLNGDPLMDGNSSIDLDEGTDGDISCSVKNHVSHAQNTIRVQPCPVCSVSVVFVLVWCLQLMVLLGLLGGFHIYMRHTSGKKQEDQKVRMRRFREGPEHTAEDS